MAGTGRVQRGLNAIAKTVGAGLTAVLCVGLMLCWAGPVHAEDGVRAQSIVIAGDSLGDGLYVGFYRVLRTDTTFTVEKRSKVSSGLSRPDFYDWVTQAKTVVDETKPDYMVFVVGGNDVQALKDDKRWVEYGTDDWVRIYRSRIKAVMDTFEASGTETFWIGMPVIRLTKLNRGVQFLNTLYKEEAKGRARVTFISLFGITADENGDFRSHYKDGSGRTRQMRTNDGIHFTTAGYIGLAEHILERIRSHRAAALSTREAD